MASTVELCGELLQEIRDVLQMTQEDLADKAGYSLRTIQRAEDSKSIKRNTANDIVAALEEENVKRAQAGMITAQVEDNVAKELKVLIVHSTASGPPPIPPRLLFIRHFGTKWGRNFGATAILDSLAKNEGTVEVLGRTCRSWLVGTDDRTKRRLQEAIVDAAQFGSTIKLIIQKSTVSVPYFSDEDMKNLREHLRQSVTSYEEIRGRLKGNEKSRVTLFFTDEPILQSMMKFQTTGEEHGWLLVSVRTDFKPEEKHVRHGSSSSVFMPRKRVAWDPQIVFKTDAPQAAEYLARFRLMLKGSVALRIRSPTPCERYRKELLGRVEEVVREYDDNYGSRLRHDTGPNLAGQAVRHFPGRSDPLDDTPPKCVQLLVTPECPGHCPMCTQWETQAKEADTDEVKDLLRHISGLGTKTVVVSGGEPLYRQDIHDVLDFVAGELDGRLKLGLLTRGICKRETRGLPELTYGEATRLANRCEWVQLSIDSLKKSETLHQGGGNQLVWTPNAAAAVARRIWKAFGKDPKRAEVAFTIHSGNVGEIAEIGEKAKELRIPSEMPIRLKFAHSGYGADFLCSVGELRELRHTLDELRATDRLCHPKNAGYLCTMLDGEGARNVAAGLPVQTTLNDYDLKGYKCHVLDLTCIINFDGNVYPCCYLFDDNVASSATRIPIGTLRDIGADRVVSWHSDKKRLRDIWWNRPRIGRDLPLERSACARCIRHLHQNGLLNKIHSILEEGAPLQLADDLDLVLQKAPAKRRGGWYKKEEAHFWL